MTSVLFILKIVGVLISGVTTLVALFRSKSFEEIEIASPIIGGPKRIERRITKEGKIAAMLAIVGIATSLLAQIIEQSVNNGRNAAAQAVTSDQLRRTEESLNYLERLGTRFDTLSFTVIYKLKTDNKDFALLENFFSQPAPDRSINPPSANTNLSSGSFLSTNWFSHLLNFSASKESASTQTKHKVAYSAKTIGYWNKRVGTNTITFVGEVLRDGNELRYEYSRAKLLAALTLFGTNSIGDDVLEFLYRPHVLLGFIPEKSPTPNETSLAVMATNLTSVPIFAYQPAAKELSILWTFDCPKTDWEQTKWMSSLPDLANATVYLAVINGPLASIAPLYGTVTFDRTTLTLTNFSGGWSGWYSCTLPNKREILGGQ